MWTVNTITNNYTVEVSINYVVLSGTSVQTVSFPPLGDDRTVALNVPYIGIAYFKDIGTTPLGPSSQTYGVLITYNELNWVFRYDGEGQLNITINEDGTLTFSSPNGGTIYAITLNSFSGYMQTYSGVNYVTTVNDGGLGATANVPIRTNATTIGEYELFTIEWIDIKQGYFALHTADGKYVTAVNGGGIGGPNNDEYPIHTDAQWMSTWEYLEFIIQENGKYAIRTKSGYYWTAVNGGGWGEAANAYPIHTDASRLGGWERFKLIPALTTVEV
jgi:hypothetical protein